MTDDSDPFFFLPLIKKKHGRDSIQKTLPSKLAHTVHMWFGLVLVPISNVDVYALGTQLAKENIQPMPWPCLAAPTTASSQTT